MAIDPWRLLSWLLAYPSEESLELLEELAIETPWLVAALTELRDIPLEHWQAEHTRLFINGFPTTVAPPYASAWQYGQLGGNTEEPLLCLYQQMGLEVVNGPPDYLGTLLECVAFAREQPQLQPLVLQVIERHLRGWVPQWATVLHQQAELLLYRHLGEQIQQLLGVDA